MPILLILISLFFSNSAVAQQTIFNVPSADITPDRKTFLQHESQFRTKDEGHYWNVTTYAARGIGHNTELDATLFNVSSPTSKNATLGTGFKTFIPITDNKNYQPKLIVGSQAAFSLQNNGVGNWTYLLGSIVIPETSTRLTAGANYGTKQIFGREVICFSGGFEQKINNKINFIGDWYAGNHNLGVFATGISYAFPKDLTFYGGYQIPNSKQVGRNAFIIEIAKIF